MKLSILFVLVVILLLFAGCTMPGTPPKKNETISNHTLSTQAKDLYINSLNKGMGEHTYTYAYEEDRNGYLVKTTLYYTSTTRAVIVEEPLVKKSAYFLPHKTIVCLAIENDTETCAVAENATSVTTYINNLDILFLNDNRLSNATQDARYLADHDYMTFEDRIDTKMHGTNICSVIYFKIDYTNLPIIDSARFKLGPGSPLVFNGSFCVDPKSGVAQEKYFRYVFRGNEVYTSFNLTMIDFTSAPKIDIPSNVSNRLVSTLIEEEKVRLKDFLSCYKKIGDLRDRCIYSYAISHGLTLACEYTGSKEDQCYLNLAVLHKDSSECSFVPDTEYRKDCYIEIGGLVKNQSICNAIKDDRKRERCVEVASSNQTSIVPLSWRVDNRIYHEATSTDQDENVSQEERDAHIDQIITND